MNPRTLRLPSALLFFAALLAAGSTRAALVDSALLLDFGANNPTTTSVASPWRGSQTGSLDSSTYNQWNNIGTSNPSSLIYANGTSATGMTVRIGSDNGSAGLTFASPSINAASVTGSSVTTLFNNSVTRDAIFTQSATATQNKGVGVQIGGLGIGTYDIYIVARNTNNSDSNFGQQASAYISSSAIDTLAYSQSGLVSKQIANSSTNTNWTAAGPTKSGNYAVLSVTISSTTDFLNILTLGLGDSGSPDYRGFLNSIEIVPTSLAPIPEPSTYALLGGAGVLSLALVSRRKPR